MVFFDMHCHLDFAPNAAEAAAELGALGAGAFAVSVLPYTADNAAGALDGQSGSLVRWGVGLHPWWIADGRAGKADEDALLDAVERSIYIGEVGLDFGKTHGQRPEDQRATFERVAHACAQAGSRVLSLHAVRAAGTVLDALELAGTLASCACIFHWFSDSSDALQRAMRAGCYFSVGPLMLESKRGREYARQIPADRLLLETDAPPEGHSYDVCAMQRQLAEACEAIAALRNTDPEALADRIAQTSKQLLSAS